MQRALARIGTNATTALALLPLILGGCAAPAPTQTALAEHADRDLEATIPNALAGEPIEVKTYRDRETLALLGVDQRLLARLGADYDDVSMAIAHRNMANLTGPHLSVYAYRVRGAERRRLANAFLRLLRHQSEGVPFERVQLDGKTVWRPRGRPVAVAGNLLYVRGETAYLVFGNRPALSRSLLAALPD